jgi:hypothetical protein
MTEQLPKDSKLDGADRHEIHIDAELVRRWLYAQSQNKAKRGGTFLWAKVSEEFCIGSTSAQQVCLRHGYEPDTIVRKS